MNNRNYEKWLRHDELERELKEELNSMDEKQIEEAFYREISFGTGGMRGIMGAGTNRINTYTIKKATKGVSKWIESQGEDAMDRGVAIAYDCRLNSKQFAQIAGAVLATRGINVYLFEELRPTPELSFAVRELNAFMGIVITASHNPPKYNGYKLYDSNGCQLVPSQIKPIIDNIISIEDSFSIESLPIEELIKLGRVKLIGQDIDKKYIERIEALTTENKNNLEKIKIVYTPLHGAGYELMKRSFETFNYKDVYFEPSQIIPDGNFSTVDLPNPENKEAFELALKLANKVKADLVIATDPDADRMGIAVLNKLGDYKLLTGNQVGALLIDYIIAERAKENKLDSDFRIINTIVTSDFGAAIGRRYGIETDSTLTGFKYIGEKIAEYESNGNQKFLFGYEESYGYLIGDFVRDKDAIQSAILFSEMASSYKKMGYTPYEKLQRLYEYYGYYKEELISFKLEGKEGSEKIKFILDEIRNEPERIVKWKDINYIEDYETGKKLYEKRDVENLNLPKSNVLKFNLKDNSWLALRPSGTEPKLKIYIGVCENDEIASEKKLEELKTKCNDFINSVIG